MIPTPPAKPLRFVEPVNPISVAEALTAFAAPAGRACRVQILRPFGVYSRRSYSSIVTLPIGPAYLAAVLEQAGYGVEIIDGMGEAVDSLRISDDGRFKIQGLSAAQILSRIDPRATVLGVSLMFSQEWPHQRDLIARIKHAYPQLIIVVGGEHATAVPELVLRTCPAITYLVRGEGELTFLQLVSAIFRNQDPHGIGGLCFLDRDGAFVANGLSKRIADVDSLPYPAWHLCKVDNYFSGHFSQGISYGRNMPVLATRGCPYQCTFCSNPFMWTTRYIMRDPARVVDEIQHLIDTYKIDCIDFTDLTAIVKKDWTLAFCRELLRRNIKITWQLPTGTRSEALDRETLQAIYDTGCSFLVYAPESASQATLDLIKKRLRIGNIAKSVLQALRVGHTVKINFIIGFPHEKRWGVMQTLWFAWRMGIRGVNDCNIAIYTPYPGSESFDEMRRAGVIKDLDDEYFHSLLIQFDFTILKSVSRNMSGWELGLYRVLGMGVFYALSYGVRPTRLIRLLRGVLRRDFQAQNLFEQRVHDYIVRVRMLRKRSSRSAV